MKKKIFILTTIALIGLIIFEIIRVFNGSDGLNKINSENKEYMDSIIINSKKIEKKVLLKNNTRKIIYAKKYDMNLSLNTDKKIISGHSKITIVNDSDDEIDYIILRNYSASVFKGNKKGRSYLSNFKDKENNNLNSIVEDDETIIKVELFKSLKAKEEMELSFDFQSDIPKQKNRFGYYTFDNNILFQLSFCFPSLAIYENGEWNKSPYIFDGAESNYTTVADYSVKIKVPKKYTVIATGIEKNDRNNNYNINGKNLREFAMVIGNNLTKKTTTYNDININNYFYNYKGNKKYINYSLDIMKESVELYSNLIGDYPYEELDLVNVFMNSAMEYPGLIMLGYPDMSIKDIDKYSQYEHILHHIPHEIAHQWFYGAIGNDPYNEPWLDEGFAEFFEEYIFPISGLKVIEQIENEKKDNYSTTIQSIADFKKLKNIFLEQTKHDKSINLSYDKYDKKNDEYSYYVYGASSMFLYELEQTMGENKFFSMLHNYYVNYRFSEVKTKDFINFVKKYDNSQKIENILNKYISL